MGRRSLWAAKGGMKHDLTSLLARASAYVAAMPPAISGNRGHDATFAVASALVHGFALSRDQAWPIMLEFNARCDPPWSEKDLEHKLDDATKLTRHSKPRGHLLGERFPVTSQQSRAAIRYDSRHRHKRAAPWRGGWRIGKCWYPDSGGAC